MCGFSACKCQLSQTDSQYQVLLDIGYFSPSWDKKKSVLDVLHGYQSVPIAEEFKEEKKYFFLGEGRIVLVGGGPLP